MSYSGNVKSNELEQYALGAYIYPPVLDVNEPSPVEAIYSTYKNLGIVAEFLKVSERHADGVLLSGANAWGAFHAVKGQVPSQLIELGVEQRNRDQISDIDFLITAADLQNLEQVVKDYVEEGLICPAEVEQFAVFKNLLGTGQTEVFSVRSHYKDIEQSLHFMLKGVLAKIGAGEEEKNKDGIGFVKTLRPNIPDSLKKFGHYPISSLSGSHNNAFDPELESLPNMPGELPENYIARMPTGGLVEINDQKASFIGLLYFYFLITPTILFVR